MDASYVIVGAAGFTLGTLAVAGRFVSGTVRHYKAALAARQEHLASLTVHFLTTNEVARGLADRIARLDGHDARVTGLLEANNLLLERARHAEAEVRERRDEIDNLEVELAAARDDAEAQERAADNWAAIAAQLGHPAVPAPRARALPLQ